MSGDGGVEVIVGIGRKGHCCQCRVHVSNCARNCPDTGSGARRISGGAAGGQYASIDIIECQGGGYRITGIDIGNDNGIDGNARVTFIVGGGAGQVSRGGCIVGRNI